MDEHQFERAERIAEAERNNALAKVRAAAGAVEKHPDFDGTHCIDCEIDIPAARLAMGKVRCIDCQTGHERSQRYADARKQA